MDMQDFFAGTGVNIDVSASTNMSSADIQAARAAAEDETDRSAASNIRKERIGESAVFDETQRLQERVDSSSTSSSTSSSSASSSSSGGAAAVDARKIAADDAAETAEIEASLRKLWKGDSDALKALEKALRPIDQYALRFREEVEPIWTKEAAEEWRQSELSNAGQREWDMEELQRRKEQMEKDADCSSDMVLAAPSRASPSDRKRAFFEERSRIDAIRKRRRMAGDDWEMHVDDRTKRKYWYNTLTHACTWTKPLVLTLRDGYLKSTAGGFAKCPPAILRYVYTFLRVKPDVLSCRVTCMQWLQVADQRSLWIRILTKQSFALHQRKLEGKCRPGEIINEWGQNWPVDDGWADNGWGVGPKHPSVVSLLKYTSESRVFGSLADALAAGHSGQTLCFEPGKHACSSDFPAITFPVRIFAGNGLVDTIAQNANSAKKKPGVLPPIIRGSYKTARGGAVARSLVSLEVGTKPIEVDCTGAVNMYGVHLSGGEGCNVSQCVRIVQGTLNMERCTLTNEGGQGGCVVVNGVNAGISVHACEILKAAGAGLSVKKGGAHVSDCLITAGNHYGVDVGIGGEATLLKNEISKHTLAGVRFAGEEDSVALDSNYIHDNSGGKLVREK